ncbi:MAG TPA: amino acid adenylation domain-containing protein [Polyangiaceae bacterium]
MSHPLESLPAPVPSVLDLPFDFRPLRGREKHFESYTFALTPERDDGGRVGSTLSAAFVVLLARYSGQASVSFRLSESSANGGPFRTRSVALEIDETATCQAILRQVSDALDAPDDSWERTASTPAHDALGGRAMIARCGAGNRAALERWLSSGGDADLTLLIEPSGKAATALVFDSSLFRRRSIERLAGHLGILVSSMSLSLDRCVSELPLLPLAERRWLESVCDGQARKLARPLVHQQIELQAAAAPDATALRFRDTSLSYRALNWRANQLAHYLAERGIGEDCRVIVCVEPGFEIVVALLGILKAGAVYVPLDPGYPRARIRALLADTQASLVITQHHLEARLELEHTPTLTLDALTATPDALAWEDPRRAIAPDQAAYLYYTSGTTGSPKGVLGNHANLQHYVHAAQQRYGIDSHDVLPAIARFSFSISMFELLTPLCAGGTLIILEREHILDPERMARTLSEVTIFHAGPSLLRGLTAYIRRHYPNFSAFCGVRHASSGGDMVPPELLETMKELFPNAEVFVIYGCSEISCMGCTYPVPRDRQVTTTYVGRPFDNVVVRVLDSAGRVLPAGIVGEIHFAGDGLTRGYLNRPELSAEKFISVLGQRFYRTGDRGRLSEDGWLEILGRNDFQTKLRGMRVELGEVEHHLRRAPGVREAVAVAKETSAQDKVLVAYVVTERANGAAASEKSARIAAIRQHLIEQLPDYMVPAVYVELDALPLNHNLKVDRRALPEPHEDDLRALSAASVREPQTHTEQLLASLWQKSLGVQRVGLDDNFFELGGHSLLGVQLGLELEAALGVRLEGMDMLREPLEVLAEICDRRLGRPVSGAARPARASTRADPVEIFHFGAGKSLYGVLHGQPGNAANAALICGPVGQEHVRARFVLTKLAKQLARAGVPTLMFDYFGSGDSLGDSAVLELARFRSDIAQAHAELQRLTQGARITAVGVRLGAPLLCQAAPQLNVGKLVLWDPVRAGSELARELGAMQRAYLRSVAHLRFWRWPRARAQSHELLGMTYLEPAFRELTSLSLAPLLAQQRVPIDWLATSPPLHAQSVFQSLASNAGRLECLDFDCGWHDISRIEDGIPDVAISERLAAMVTEQS